MVASAPAIIPSTCTERRCVRHTLITGYNTNRAIFGAMAPTASRGWLSQHSVLTARVLDTPSHYHVLLHGWGREASRAVDTPTRNGSQDSRGYLHAKGHQSTTIPSTSRAGHVLDTPGRGLDTPAGVLDTHTHGCSRGAVTRQQRFISSISAVPSSDAGGGAHQPTTLHASHVRRKTRRSTNTQRFTRVASEETQEWTRTRTVSPTRRARRRNSRSEKSCSPPGVCSRAFRVSG